MAIASKTLLQQMRYTRMGAPFCSVSTKSTIDSSLFDFVDKGSSFYGFNSITTPFYTNYLKNPIRRGAANKIIALRNLWFGGVYKGEPLYSTEFAISYPVYEKHAVRNGNAFSWITAKSSIDASSDFYYQGSPFYIKFGAAPTGYNTTQFFMVF